MPDMPEPPMPTKWMRFTLCRMCKLHAGVGAAARGVGLSEGARFCRHCGETISIEAKKDLRELFRLRLELLERDAGAAVREESRVRGLLVHDEPGQWKEDRRQARRRDFRDGHGAGTADEHVA